MTKNFAIDDNVIFQSGKVLYNNSSRQLNFLYLPHDPGKVQPKSRELKAEREFTN